MSNRFFHFSKATEYYNINLNTPTRCINICYLPAGRFVLGKTGLEVLHKGRDQRPRFVHRPRAQFFSIRTFLPANNIFTHIFIYFFWNFCRLCLSRVRFYLLAGKMVKFRPLTKSKRLQPIRLQNSFLSCPLALPKKVIKCTILYDKKFCLQSVQFCHSDMV